MPRAQLTLALVAASSVLLSCGRPATTEDCEKIVTEVTTAVVRKHLPLADEGTLAKEVAQQKARQEKKMMEQCVGKRITDEIMSCIRDSQDPDRIVEDCF